MTENVNFVGEPIQNYDHIFPSYSFGQDTRKGDLRHCESVLTTWETFVSSGSGAIPGGRLSSHFARVLEYLGSIMRPFGRNIVISNTEIYPSRHGRLYSSLNSHIMKVLGLTSQDFHHSIYETSLSVTHRLTEAQVLAIRPLWN